MKVLSIYWSVSILQWNLCLSGPTYRRRNSRTFASHCIFAETLTHIKLFSRLIDCLSLLPLRWSLQLASVILHSHFLILNWKIRSRSKSCSVNQPKLKLTAVPAVQWFCYPSRQDLTTPKQWDLDSNYDRLPSILLVRIRCSHVANVTYPPLAH